MDKLLVAALRNTFRMEQEDAEGLAKTVETIFKGQKEVEDMSIDKYVRALFYELQKENILKIRREESKEQGKQMRKFYWSFNIEEIKKEADRNSIDLIIENTGVNSLSYDYDMEEMMEIAREFEIGICLDTGHANISGIGSVSIEELMERTEELHLHDNFGEEDEHLPVGDGNIEWDRYRPLMLKKEMIAVHEVRLGNNTENEIIRSRNRAEEIKENCFT